MSAEDFMYRIQPPNPGATKQSSRRQGYVEATVDGVRVGSLAYGLGPPEGDIVLTRVEVDPGFQRQGCATGMLLELRTMYPGAAVHASPSSNSEAGDAWLSAMSRQGLTD